MIVSRFVQLQQQQQQTSHSQKEVVGVEKARQQSVGWAVSGQPPTDLLDGRPAEVLHQLVGEGLQEAAQFKQWTEGQQNGGGPEGGGRLQGGGGGGRVEAQRLTVPGPGVNAMLSTAAEVGIHFFLEKLVSCGVFCVLALKML